MRPVRSGAPEQERLAGGRRRCRGRGRAGRVPGGRRRGGLRSGRLGRGGARRSGGRPRLAGPGGGGRRLRRGACAARCGTRRDGSAHIRLGGRRGRRGGRRRVRRGRDRRAVVLGEGHHGGGQSACHHTECGQGEPGAAPPGRSPPGPPGRGSHGGPVRDRAFRLLSREFLLRPPAARAGKRAVEVALAERAVTHSIFRRRPCVAPGHLRSVRRSTPLATPVRGEASAEITCGSRDLRRGTGRGHSCGAGTCACASTTRAWPGRWARPGAARPTWARYRPVRVSGVVRRAQAGQVGSGDESSGRTRRV